MVQPTLAQGAVAQVEPVPHPATVVQVDGAREGKVRVRLTVVRVGVAPAEPAPLQPTVVQGGEVQEVKIPLRPMVQAVIAREEPAEPGARLVESEG